MNPAHLTLAALLITGCAGAPDAAQPRAEEESSLIKDAPQTRRYALVSPEWGLFAAPKQDTMAIPPLWTGERGRGEGRGLFRAVRYMGEHAGWVALETIPRGEEEALSTCYDALSALSSFRLRLYVPRDALTTVNTQRLRQEHADGTWLELAAGVALLSDGDQTGRFIASLNNLLIPLQLDPSLTGTSFEPAAPPEEEEADAKRTKQTHILTQEAISAGQIMVGGQPLRRLPADNDRFMNNDLLGDVSSAGDELVAGTMTWRCAQLRAVAPASQVEPLGGFLGGISGRGASARKLMPGTSLFWSDGRPAGEVVHTYGLPQNARILHDVRMECFSPAPNITLCRKIDAR